MNPLLIKAAGLKEADFLGMGGTASELVDKARRSNVSSGGRSANLGALEDIGGAASAALDRAGSAVSGAARSVAEPFVRGARQSAAAYRRGMKSVDDWLAPGAEAFGEAAQVGNPKFRLEAPNRGLMGDLQSGAAKLRDQAAGLGEDAKQYLPGYLAEEAGNVGRGLRRGAGYLQENPDVALGAGAGLAGLGGLAGLMALRRGRGRQAIRALEAAAPKALPAATRGSEGAVTRALPAMVGG